MGEAKKAEQAGNYILTVYFLVLTVLYPFYMQDGYWEIGAVKYFFFRRISLVIMGLMLPLVIVLFLYNRKAGEKVKISIIDRFVFGFLVMTFISYLFSDYKGEAFWGAEGWYMGLVSLLIFMGIYFLFSRYFIWNHNMLYVVFGSSAIVFLLGILNRYSIYPIPIPVKAPQFISTLGNINWFCGCWSVIFPLGVMFYWNSDKGWQRTAAGIYVMISFVSGVTQGSNSAYLALAGVLVFVFCLSFRGNQKMYRFLEICILLALSCQMARLLRYVPGFSMNYEGGLGAVFTNTNLTLYIGMAALALYLLFHYLVKHKDYQITGRKALSRGVPALIAVTFLVYIILTIVNTCVQGGIAGLAGRQAFTFNDTWGSSRGITWISGLLIYRDMTPLQKLVGVGPDCFAQYVYKIPELTERLYIAFGDFRLTNAHNEWITMLVNHGALGLVCYVGIFISAFVRFLKTASKQPTLYLCAASILSYMVHDIVSFQQILNTPFIFLVIGIGEGIIRDYCIENDKL